MNNEHPLVPVQGGGNLSDPGAAPPPQEEPNPIKTAKSLMRGRWPWAIGLAVLLAGVFGTLGYLLPKPVYTSTGYLMLHQNVRPILSTDLTRTEGRAYEAMIQSQVQMIRSQRVIIQAMNNSTWNDLGDRAASIGLAEFQRSLNAEHQRGTQDIFVTFTHPSPEVAERAVEAVINEYENIYRNEQATNQTDTFNQLEQRRTNLENVLSSKERQRSQIADQFGAVRDLSQIYANELRDVYELESRIKQLKLALPVSAEGGEASPSGAGAGTGGSVAQAGGGRGDQPAATATATAMDPQNLTPEQIARMDATMRGYLQDRQDLKRRIASELEGVVGPQHPRRVEADRLLATINQEIQRRAEQIRQRVAEGGGATQQTATTGLTVAERRRQVERLQRMLAQERTEASDVARQQARIQDLTREITNVNEKLAQTRNRIDSLEMASGALKNRLEIISDGNRPLEPSRDKRKLTAAAGVLFGGGAGFGIVLLIGMLDRRLRSMHDAHDQLGQITMLGILPRLPDDLAEPEHAAVASHCVHQIRTLLQIGPEAHGRRVFTVTSPAAGNGKTSLTLAMGLSFAASGAKTLLIDCDMGGGGEGLTERTDRIIRRKIGQVLQREQLVTEQQVEQALRVAQESNRRLGETLVELGYLNEEDLRQALSLQERSPVGLLDALEGEPLDSCIAETGIPRLSILPIGAAELADVSRVSASQIGRLMDDARKLYDIVLLDTGPVPGSLEASHAASEADGVVLVVSRGQQRDQAEKAIEHLTSVDARVAGLVFNRAEGRDVERVGEASTSHRGNGSSSRWVQPGRPADGEQSSRFGPVARAVASSSSKSPREDSRS